ncbi:hypothetical protein NC651_033246 [Populus alba x Populus x berolinensis]|nr:hypothetical protein NC651_033246 [Populus alba x Populus x berolinensis]
MDAGVNKDNCSSLPQHPLTITNFNYGDPYNPPISLSSFGEESQMLMIFMKSANPVKSPLFVNPTRINGTYSGVLIKSNITYVENLCKVELVAISSMPIRDYINISYMDIHNRLAYGFELS